VNALEKYKFQGLNIDLEELKEDSDEPMIGFVRKLHDKLKEKNLLLTQEIMAGNDDFNVPALARYNDYLVLMAYDQHYSISDPGPISSQRWIEKTLDETAKEIPSEKIILGLAAYGYDWPHGDEADAITYQKALATANIYKQKINFDNDTYNSSYQYKDDDGLLHDVYFTDAVTNFNVIRFADEYGAAGTALWRLGAEDERLWTFYNRDLSDEALTKTPFDFNQLRSIELSNEKPDYDGDGEIMDVIAKPQKGIINLEIDSSEKMISEQEYQQLPTKYVIRKYGNVNKQVVLTFDDGPDANYTPQILDILKKESVKAAFFVIGVNGEENLPLVKRIVQEGHEIGNHTFTHPNMATISTARAQSELSSTRLLIEAATGRSTILYRIPYNADSEPTNDEELRPVALGKENNYYTIGESIDPLDWQPGITADTILQRVIKKYESNPGKGIILLHDSGGDREETVKALPEIIHYFKRKGIQFISLGQLLGKSKDELMPVVNSDLVKVDSGIVVFLYWTGRVFLSAFWVAIFLFLAKTIGMGMMATIQFYKTKRKQLFAAPVKINEEVTVIIPAYNEEVNAVATIYSLLRQTYASLKIIFVDDGSTDSTLEKVKKEFLHERRLTIISKLNGGKASALNEGILYADTPYVICIDGDTQLQPDAVEKLMAYFIPIEGNRIVGAVAGNVKVGNRKNMLTWWQHIEYTTAQNFDRRAFDLINGIIVVPGAIGAFYRDAIIEAGGFTSDTLAEDCDLTIRLLRRGYTVRNCPDAIAITEAPETFKQFMKQRFRWNYGVMQSFWKNRDACFNPKYKALGMVSLPNILIYQIILPFLAPLADLMFLFSLFWSRNDSVGMEKIFLYYVIFLFVDILISLIAFSFEKEKLKDLLWLIPQRFIYRQLMYVVLFRSVRKAIKGEIQGWGVLKRTGNVRPSFK
jgi:cellulose synthase/poly-beta-1,6-N-acetylglucosamine synthase-like glycosyltransferase/peptidoglycan/xylan/chitin deacetylase (PgdA/CDA1 family)